MWSKQPWRKSHFLYDELTRTLFLGKSINNRKIIITHYRLIIDAWINTNYY